MPVWAPRQSCQKYVLVYERVTVRGLGVAATVERMNLKSQGAPARLLSGEILHDDATDLFAVERRLPGITEHGLAMLQAALLQSSARFTARGEHITYLRSTFLPDQDRLLSLFAALSLEVVRAANDASLVPYLGIHRAIDLPNPGESPNE
jgi:hypothetical protein